MTVEEVMQYRRAIPFKPFVLVLKDGRRFEIHEPTAVGRNSAFTRVGVADRDSGEFFDIELVSHVELLEPASETQHGSAR